MTNNQVKARKLELKKHAFQIRGINRFDKIERSILLSIRRKYEEQIDRVFDPELSKKLDCLNFLTDEQ